MSTSFSHQPCRRNDSIWYCLDAMIYGAVLWLQALRVFCQSFSSPPSPYAGRFWDGFEVNFVDHVAKSGFEPGVLPGVVFLFFLTRGERGHIRNVASQGCEIWKRLVVKKCRFDPFVKHYLLYDVDIDYVILSEVSCP
jgi:hypothetical protein